MDKNIQVFPSGERRVYENDVLVEHVRAPHDKKTTNLIGKRQDQMPPPAALKPEDE